MPYAPIAALFTIAAAFPQASPDRTADFTKMTVEQLKADIETQHPAAYYVLARKLFDSRLQDEATFWFYAGQLRYRFQGATWFDTLLHAGLPHHPIVFTGHHADTFRRLARMLGINWISKETAV